MRTLVTLLFASAVAQAAGFAEPIDLSAPGALQSLQGRRPDHYAKAQAIIELVKAKPNQDLVPWIEARFDASDVDFRHLWLVTYPPKMKVSFTLDEARYTAIVVPVLEPTAFVR
jgi:hypothetical protein